MCCVLCCVTVFYKVVYKVYIVITIGRSRNTPQRLRCPRLRVQRLRCGTPEASRGTCWLGWRLPPASEPEANAPATLDATSRCPRLRVQRWRWRWRWCADRGRGVGPVLAREKLIREREGSCGTPEASRGTRWLCWRLPPASEPEANASATNDATLALPLALPKYI